MMRTKELRDLWFLIASRVQGCGIYWKEITTHGRYSRSWGLCTGYFFGALILYRPVPPEVFSLHTIKFHETVEVRNQRGQRSNDFTWRILGGRSISSTLSFLFLLASSSCFDCWIWSFKKQIVSFRKQRAMSPTIAIPALIFCLPFFLVTSTKAKACTSK